MPSGNKRIYGVPYGTQKERTPESTQLLPGVLPLFWRSKPIRFQQIDLIILSNI